jgi:hypothetical protein
MLLDRLVCLSHATRHAGLLPIMQLDSLLSRQSGLLPSCCLTGWPTSVMLLDRLACLRLAPELTDPPQSCCWTGELLQHILLHRLACPGHDLNRLLDRLVFLSIAAEQVTYLSHAAGQAGLPQSHCWTGWPASATLLDRLAYISHDARRAGLPQPRC